MHSGTTVRDKDLIKEMSLSETEILSVFKKHLKAYNLDTVQSAAPSEYCLRLMTVVYFAVYHRKSTAFFECTKFSSVSFL